MSFKLLSLNVFIGAPNIIVPGVLELGRRPLSQLKNPMRRPLSRGTARLKLQFEQIRKANADIICLQEVVSTDMAEAYAEALPDYEAYYHPHSTLRCTASWLAWHMAEALMPLMLYSVGSCSELTASLLWMIITCLLRKATSKAFIVGEPAGMLVTLWKKNRFALVRATCPAFKQQFGGDREDVLMACLKRRHYHCVELRSVDTCSGPSLVSVINTHNSLGQKCPQHFNNRRLQLEQLAHESDRLRTVSDVLIAGDFNTDAGTDQTVGTVLCEQAGMTDTYKAYGNVNSYGHTWHHQNPYTQGWHLEMDRRLVSSFLCYFCRPDRPRLALTHP